MGPHRCSPSLLVLDDLDLLAPSSAQGGPDSEAMAVEAAEASRLAEWLADVMAGLGGRADAPVAVAAAARDAAGVHPALRQVGGCGVMWWVGGVERAR